MSPVNHIVVSSVLAAGLGYGTGSWGAAAACLLSGVLMDVDHIFDYWIAKRSLWLSYRQLWRFCGYEPGGRLTLVFHSYEFLIIFWLLIAVLGWPLVWVGMAVGMTVHMLMDQIGNPLRPLALFFVYRLRNQFSKQSLFPRDYYEKYIA